MLAHNSHDVQVFKRHVHANRANGVDNEWLTPEQAKDSARRSNIAPACAIRFWAPLCSGAAAPPATMRSPGATPARRTRYGVDIIAELRGDGHSARRRGRGVRRSKPPRHDPHAQGRRLAAGSTSVVMAMAGVRMPLESYPLQALVSEPVKPVIPCVVM